MPRCALPTSAESSGRISCVGCLTRRPTFLNCADERGPTVRRLHTLAPLPVTLSPIRRYLERLAGAELSYCKTFSPFNSRNLDSPLGTTSTALVYPNGG